MTRIQKLLRNSKLLFWGRAFIEIKAINSIVVLFYLHRGITLNEAFYLSIVFSIGTLLFEIPTGYLADRIGRKNTILLGVLAYLVNGLILFFAHGFIPFVVAMLFSSLSFSLFSGTEEAMLYDSLKEAGEENKMSHHNGRINAARQIFKIFIPTIAAFIAKDLLEWQFQIVIGLEILGPLVAIFIFSKLTEPRHEESVLENEKGIFKESLFIIKRDPFLFHATINRLLIFIATFICWRIYQPFLNDLGISVVWLGIYYFAMHAIIFFGNWHTGWIEKNIGTTQTIFWSTILLIIGTTGIILFKNPVVIFIILLLTATIEPIRTPVFAHFMNKRLTSRSRATTLSNLNVFKAVMDIPILFLSGWLASLNYNYVFALAIILFLIAMIFFPIKKQDLQPKKSFTHSHECADDYLV